MFLWLRTPQLYRHCSGTIPWLSILWRIDWKDCVFDCTKRFGQLAHEGLLNSEVVDEPAQIALYESLLASEHRTTNGDEADFFYVPLLHACIVEQADDTPHLNMQVPSGINSFIVAHMPVNSFIEYPACYFGVWVRKMCLVTSCQFMFCALIWISVSSMQGKFMGLRQYFAGDYTKRAYLHIQQNYPYWNRSAGRDHIWVDRLLWKFPFEGHIHVWDWVLCGLSWCSTLVEYSQCTLCRLPFKFISCARLLLINGHVCWCWVSFSHGMKEHARRQRRYGIAWCWFTGATQTQITRGPPRHIMLITGISFHQSGVAIILATTLQKTLSCQHGNIRILFQSCRTSRVGKVRL